MSTVGLKMLFCFGPSVVGSAIQFGCVVHKISLIHKIKKEIGGHIYYVSLYSNPMAWGSL